MMDIQIGDTFTYTGDPHHTLSATVYTITDVDSSHITFIWKGAEPLGAVAEDRHIIEQYFKEGKYTLHKKSRLPEELFTL